ncbi:DegV domain-containing protein [Clostridia bacterium]|nr:DegV domain-containing protein [Clostridia bacterium]
MKILLITDAASDVSHEAIEGKPIKIVAAYTHIDGRTFRDFYDVSPLEYCEMLKACETYPTTSMAPPPDYLAAYKEAREQGYTHIIVTQVSSTASGTINSAKLGVDLLEAEGITDMTIAVVDTLTYSVAYGHNVVLAADMIAAGKGFQEIVDWLAYICPRTEVLFGAYTLKYMRRSGRINSMAAFVGEALGMRPIILTHKGRVDPIDRARGDKNVVPKLAEHLKVLAATDIPQKPCIIYTDIPAHEIDLLETLILEALPSATEVVRYQLGSTITTNTGPHTIALTFYANP